jgi:hypothetical protein
MKESLERLIKEAKRHQDQQNRIGEGGQDSGALITIGAFVVRGPRGPVQSDPRYEQRGDVGKIVERVADQRNGVAHIAA